LEINTVPGMTETSLLPMAAARAGLSYDELTELILQSALVRGEREPFRTR
jgi:D-alanine-D-alanine ligase